MRLSDPRPSDSKRDQTLSTERSKLSQAAATIDNGLGISEGGDSNGNQIFCPIPVPRFFDLSESCAVPARGQRYDLSTDRQGRPRQRCVEGLEAPSSKAPHNPTWRQSRPPRRPPSGTSPPRKGHD